MVSLDQAPGARAGGAWRRTRLLARLIAGALFLTARPTAVSAQSDTKTPKSPPAPAPWALWATLSPVGTATVGGRAIAGAISFQRGDRVFSARFAGAEGPPCTSSDCWPDAVDLSLLYGAGYAPSSATVVSGALGLGIAGYRNSGGIAVAGEVQATWRFSRVLGIGVYGWGNSLGPQAGLGLAITAGRLR